MRGAQPAKSLEPSLPLSQPREPPCGCPVRSVPRRARLARVHGETCPSQALRRPRLNCQQRKVSGAPHALLPRPGAPCAWPQAEQQPDGRPPGQGAGTRPERGLGRARRLWGRDAPGQLEWTRTGRRGWGRGARLCNWIWCGWGTEGHPATLVTAREERGCVAALWVPDQRHSLGSARQPQPGRTGGTGGGCGPERFQVFKCFPN